MDVLSEIVLSIARSSGLSPLDESVLRGPVAATSGSAQAQRLLRVVESVLRLREATGSDDSAEPLLEHIRGRLPVNRMGNTIEDVWWRLARLVRMHVPAAPSIQWNDWATYWGSDWPEFIDTVVTGFGLSAPPDSRQAWGVMALDILEHSTIELLPVAEVENLSDEAVYKSLEAMGARFRWRRGSTPAHLQMADENLVRCLRRIEVQFGSNLGIRTPRPTPGTFYTYAGVSAIWILGLGTLLSLSMFGWFFAALLASGYVLTLARSHDWRPIQTTFAALDRRDLRRVRASLTECSVEDLVQRIRTGMRSQPRLCRRCGYNIDGLPEARCPECGTAFKALPIGAAPGGGVSGQPFRDPRSVRRGLACLATATLGPFVVETIWILAWNHVPGFSNTWVCEYGWIVFFLPAVLGIWLVQMSWPKKLLATILYLPVLYFALPIYALLFAGVVYGIWL